MNNNINRICLINGIAIIIVDIYSIKDPHIRTNRIIVDNILDYPKLIEFSPKFLSYFYK